MTHNIHHQHSPSQRFTNPVEQNQVETPSSGALLNLNPDYADCHLTGGDVFFNSTNYDALPNGRLCFGIHFREIIAHNQTVTLSKQFSKVTTSESEEFNKLVAQLEEVTDLVKRLLELATSRLNDETRHSQLMQASDQKRLQDLRKVAKVLEILEKTYVIEKKI